MNTEMKQTNEKWILSMSNCKQWIWKETGNIYEFSTLEKKLKIKPTTLKAYIELSAIVRKPFMLIFVELPEDYDFDKVWNIIETIS